MPANMTRTYINYLLVSGVVFFCVWFFVNYTDKNIHHFSADDGSTVPQPQPQQADQLHDMQQANIPDDISDIYIEAAPAGPDGKNNAHDAASVAPLNQPDTQADDAVSDADWFVAIMERSRNRQDNIININIVGSINHGGVDTVAINRVANDQTGNDSDSESAPTENELITENKVDCPSMMYMGGNDYGRNMLVKMGCVAH